MNVVAPPADGAELASPRRDAAVRAAGAAVLLAAIALAYAGAPAGPFQFDDWWAIVGNDAVHSLPAWYEALPGIRPLLKLVNTLNWVVAPTASAFHLVNLAIHAAATLALWALFAQWLPRLAPRAARPAGVAFATALLFAVHPAATEAVAYVSGRSVALAAALQLATLLALTAARDGRRGAPTLAALLFAMALAVRETAVVAPVAWLLLARCAGDGWRTALAPLRGIAVVLALGSVAVVATSSYDGFFAASLGARDPGAQLLAQADAHLYLLTGPLPGLVLNIDPDVRVPAAVAARHGALLSGAAALAAIAWRRRRSHAWLAFVLGWYVVQLAPTNSLLPRLDLVSDRHLYLALAGPLLAVSLALSALPRVAGPAALALLVAASTARTADRVDDYRSELALWTATVGDSPGKARPWTNLGHALAAAGDTAGARAAYGCALLRDPDYRQAAWNLAAIVPAAPPPRPGGCDPSAVQ